MTANTNHVAVGYPYPFPKSTSSETGRGWAQNTIPIHRMVGYGYSCYRKGTGRVSPSLPVSLSPCCQIVACGQELACLPHLFERARPPGVQSQSQPPRLPLSALVQQAQMPPRLSPSPGNSSAVDHEAVAEVTKWKMDSGLDAWCRRRYDASSIMATCLPHAASTFDGGSGTS